MKRFFGVLLLLLLCYSCGEKLMEPPEDLIQKEKMIQILKELVIINSAKKTNVAALQDEEIEPTQLVFEKYGIDSLQFVNSDRYYASIPLEYEAMYEKIEELLEAQKKEVVEMKHLNDSLELQKKIKNSIKKKVSEGKDLNALKKTSDN